MVPFANLFGFTNPVELAIIAGVVLVLFGGSKLAGFGKSAGEALREFKKATHDDVAPAEVVSADRTKLTGPDLEPRQEVPVVTRVGSDKQI